MTVHSETATVYLSPCASFILLDLHGESGALLGKLDIKSKENGLHVLLCCKILDTTLHQNIILSIDCLRHWFKSGWKSYIGASIILQWVGGWGSHTNSEWMDYVRTFLKLFLS